MKLLNKGLLGYLDFFFNPIYHVLSTELLTQAWLGDTSP